MHSEKSKKGNKSLKKTNSHRKIQPEPVEGVDQSKLQVAVSDESNGPGSGGLVTSMRKRAQKKQKQTPALAKQPLSPAQGFLAMAEEALPNVLGARSFTSLVKGELKRHHRWLGVIFHYSDQFPRVLRVISLATNIIVMLFIQSITYNLTNGDDGSCARNSNETDCLALPSAYATGESKCYWIPAESSSTSSTSVSSISAAGSDSSSYLSSTAGQCKFVEPSQSIKVVLFVAIFSALVSTPIALLAELMISRFLAAPLSTSRVSKQQADQMLKLTSISPKGHENMRKTLTSKEEVVSEDFVEHEFKALVADLKMYLSTLQSEQERAEFRSK